MGGGGGSLNSFRSGSILYIRKIFLIISSDCTYLLNSRFRRLLLILLWESVIFFYWRKVIAQFKPREKQRLVAILVYEKITLYPSGDMSCETFQLTHLSRGINQYFSNLSLRPPLPLHQLFTELPPRDVSIYCRVTLCVYCFKYNLVNWLTPMIDYCHWLVESSVYHTSWDF